MANYKRIPKSTFILLPEEGIRDDYIIKASQRACRLALDNNYLPVCPSLFYRSFMSSGEAMLTRRQSIQQWLLRCERIWLIFPLEADRLDYVSYTILEKNRRKTAFGTRVFARPLYQISIVNDLYEAVPVSNDELDDLLLANLSVGVVRSL